MSPFLVWQEMVEILPKFQRLHWLRKLLRKFGLCYIRDFVKPSEIAFIYPPWWSCPYWAPGVSLFHSCWLHGHQEIDARCDNVSLYSRFVLGLSSARVSDDLLLFSWAKTPKLRILELDFDSDCMSHRNHFCGIDTHH